MASRGLLVDWGGVLTSNIFESFSAFCRSEGIDPERVREVFVAEPAARELLFDLECGRMQEPEFERRFGAMLQIAEPAGLIDRLFDGMRPDYAMIGAVRAAREAGVRTGLISNSWGVGRYDRDAFPELFDGVVISAEEGTRKPDPRMYELGAERIGLEPSACVYVDDLPFNLPPAEQLGMVAVHHVSSAETIPELERLLSVRLT